MLLVSGGHGCRERFVIAATSDLLHYLVTLSGCQLAFEDINLPVFSKVAYHLVVCGKNGFIIS